MLSREVEFNRVFDKSVFSNRHIDRKHCHIVETPSRETLPLPMTAVILAGGRSLRMGQAKAFLPIYGTTFVEHQINILQKLFSEMFLVTNKPDEYNHLNIDIVKDIIPDKGPLVGIFSALLVSEHDHVFVVACDMPLIEKRLIRELVSHRHGADALVLAHPDGLEPLLAVYSKKCIEPLEEAIFAGKRKAKDFLEGIEVRKYILPSSYTQAGILPPYFNVDTPKEYSSLLINS